MVDEQIARAWGKLNNASQVRYGEDAHSVGGVWWADGEAIPDPATQPWEWWVALTRSGVQVILEWEFQTKSWMIWHDEDTHFGDTPEAALEATIRAWEASVVQCSCTHCCDDDCECGLKCRRCSDAG